MLLKLGVDISRLNREIRRALPDIEEIFKTKAKEEAVITSTFGDVHGEGSLPYHNDAIDIRRPQTQYLEIASGLRSRLGKDFDVILKPDHIHIEYDPKT